MKLALLTLLVLSTLMSTALIAKKSDVVSQVKPRIVGGEIATEGDWPWMSALVFVGNQVNTSLDVEGETFETNAFNFGPKAEQNHTVVNLLQDLGHHWGFKSSEEAYEITSNIPFHEAGLLKLNCDKALFHLKWESTLVYDETIHFVGDWYTAYYREKKDMYALTLAQLDKYETLASSRNRTWASSVIL